MEKVQAQILKSQMENTKSTQALILNFQMENTEKAQAQILKSQMENAKSTHAIILNSQMENTEKAQAQILNHSGEVVARAGSLRSLNKPPAASLAPSLPSHLSPSIINSRVFIPTHCHSLTIASRRDTNKSKENYTILPVLAIKVA